MSSYVPLRSKKVGSKTAGLKIVIEKKKFQKFNEKLEEQQQYANQNFHVEMSY